jgi:hypothetical protein
MSSKSVQSEAPGGMALWRLKALSPGSAPARAHAALPSITTAEAQLRAEVTAAVATLDELRLEHERLGEKPTAALGGSVAGLRDRLARVEVAAVLVGEQEAGRRTFLDAVLGVPLFEAGRRGPRSLTYVRCAPRPVYRARLRTGELIEFEDREAGDRQEIARQIEQLDRRLGDGSRAIRPAGDLGAALTQAITAHADSQRDCAGAEETQDACQRSFADAAAEVERRTAARDAEHGAVNDHERGLIGATRELERANRSLTTARSRRDVHARVHRLALPPASGAADHLAQARRRLDEATAAAPFLLRPMPWWVVWIVIVPRVVLDWVFRSKVAALRAARREHRQAGLAVEACDADAEVQGAAGSVATATTRLDEARQALASAQAHLQDGEARQAAAEGLLASARAVVMKCRRVEEVAARDVWIARSGLLEDAARMRFCAELRELTDPERRGQHVAELAIEYPAQHLPEGVAIIDIPDLESATQDGTSWPLLRDQVDCCLVVAELRPRVLRSPCPLVQEIQTAVPYVALILSKLDHVLTAAAASAGSVPWQHAEDAQRVAVRRFAQDTGRAAEEVLSVAVDAGGAARDPSAADARPRFASEMTRLFAALPLASATRLGAQATEILRRGIAMIDDAQARAEARHRAHLDALEGQRITSPADLQAQQLATIDDRLRVRADQIAASAVAEIDGGIDQMQQHWVTQIGRCSNKTEVKEVIGRLAHGVQAALAKVMQQVDQNVARQSRALITEIEDPVLEPVRVRCKRVGKQTGSKLVVRLDAGRVSGASLSIDLAVGVERVVKDFEHQRLAVSAGGAVAGAALGSVVPGIGTAVGAAVGALAGLFKTLGSLKQRCIAELCNGLGKTRQDLHRQAETLAAQIRRAIHHAIALGFAEALTSYQNWFDHVVAAERAQAEEERRQFSGLIRIREALVRHDQALSAHRQDAMVAWRELCFLGAPQGGEVSRASAGDVHVSRERSQWIALSRFLWGIGFRKLPCSPEPGGRFTDAAVESVPDLLSRVGADPARYLGVLEELVATGVLEHWLRDAQRDEQLADLASGIRRDREPRKGERWLRVAARG